MNEKITEKEKEILKYIIQFKSVNGYSPSVREIAQGVNTKSLNHVYSALEDLKVKEYCPPFCFHPFFLRISGVREIGTILSLSAY